MYCLRYIKSTIKGFLSLSSISVPAEPHDRAGSTANRLLPTGYCLPAIAYCTPKALSFSPINVSAEPLDGAGPRKHRKALRHAASRNSELSRHASDVDDMLLMAPIKPTPSHQPLASNLKGLFDPKVPV